MTALVHPEGPEGLRARDRLLQAALRPEGAPFPIAREYPLVLGEGGAKLSWCLVEGGAVLAHANLWPRTLRGNGTSVRVGLVGNVATDERHRGKGVMSRLMTELKQEAVKQGLEALVLWSDLLEFYQKIGFQSHGGERRYVFAKASLARIGQAGPAGRTMVGPARASGGPAAGAAPGYAVVGADTLDEARLARWLAARYPAAATLDRTPSEFATQLTIPATTIVASGDSYLLMGKGCDMVGVVHEWAAPSPAALLRGLETCREAGGFAEIMVLTPPDLAPDWHDALVPRADESTTHHMALCWFANAETPARELLARGFIWGLDSI